MKRDIVLNKLRLMYVDYERFMAAPERTDGSAGLVVNYGATGGGRTNRISDHVAMQAIRNAYVDPKNAERAKWLECTWSVFMHFLSQTGTREKIIAHVLYHKAFLGWTFAKIADNGLPNGVRVSRQRIYQYFDAAVDEIVKEAVKRGLLK